MLSTIKILNLPWAKKDDQTDKNGNEAIEAYKVTELSPRSLPSCTMLAVFSASFMEKTLFLLSIGRIHRGKLESILDEIDVELCRWVLALNWSQNMESPEIQD